MVTDNVILTGEPSRFTLVVLGAQVLPAGAPLQLSAITPVKPEIGVAARLKVAIAPGATVAES